MTITIANITPVLVNGVHFFINRIVQISSRLNNPWGLANSLHPLHRAICVMDPSLARTVTHTIFITKAFHPFAIQKNVWSVARPIDPSNKFNINSFSLMTTYLAFEILLKTYSFNGVNSGKLYILDLLEGSMKSRLEEKGVARRSTSCAGWMPYLWTTSAHCFTPMLHSTHSRRGGWA